MVPSQSSAALDLAGPDIGLWGDEPEGPRLLGLQLTQGSSVVFEHHQPGGPHNLDGNGDGVTCESLQSRTESFGIRIYIDCIYCLFPLWCLRLFYETADRILAGALI